ncbi:tungsten cofactor oxidoreductase radical SAM maturase [Hippea sp. KM1]|uniref:tungsten cofactor oxidoreductase radical SAM maturase n=1 Tax=Hippea sp. KM1 TaxID=944481 RepID=UPI00046D1E6E|nr:tungsten cofactor oxidoreductase radical SAM maturase [Hippea sp. KM1]
MRDVFNLKNNQIILNDSDDIKRVYVELTNACNFKCKMCFKNTFVEPEGYMDEDTIESLKKQLKELPQLKEVVIGGIGENLLHPLIRDVLSFLKDELGVYVILQTNGFFLSRFSDFMLSKGIDNIVVSVDNSDVGHLSNDVAYRTIKSINDERLKRRRDTPVFSIEVVIDKDSLDGLDRTVRRFIGAGVKDIIISNLLPVDESMVNRVLYPSCDRDILKDVIDVAQGVISMTLPYFEIKTERKCNFIDKKALVIRWDGEVAPCYRFLHTATEFVLGRKKRIYAHTFGNINKEHLLSIWNRRDYKWFRFVVDNALYPSCIDCNFNESCDFVKDTSMDCWGNEPSCADCLWSRNIIICP